MRTSSSGMPTSTRPWARATSSEDSKTRPTFFPYNIPTRSSQPAGGASAAHFASASDARIPRQTMPAAAPLIVRKAAVLGAGVMGAQIAAHLVNAGVATYLYELAAKDGERN